MFARKLFKPLLVLLLCCSIGASAQDDSSAKLAELEKQAPGLFNSLTTEVLSHVLQAGIKNGFITGKEGQYQLKTTLFGIMLLLDPKKNIDTNYFRLGYARNLELTGGVETDEDNSINAFSPRLKYAIVNRRDPANADNRHMLHNALDGYLRRMATQSLLADIARIGTKMANDSVTYDLATRKAIQHSLIKFAETQLEEDLHPLILAQLAVMYPGMPFSDMMEEDLAIRDKAQRVYDTLAQSFRQRGLLTVAMEGDYHDYWRGAGAHVEYMKGTGWNTDESAPWDIYLAADFSMAYDSSGTRKSNLDRRVLSWTAGLNKVLLHTNDRDRNAIVEVLGAMEYVYVMRGLLPEEREKQFNLNFTFSVRVAPSLYLPVMLKYNPESGNVFGFLSVKWDMPKLR